VPRRVSVFFRARVIAHFDVSVNFERSELLEIHLGSVHSESHHCEKRSVISDSVQLRVTSVKAENDVINPISIATSQSADHVPNFHLRVSDISLVVFDHLHG
jgi:hypothetical protein